MLSTTLTESCFLVVTQARVIGVAQLAAVRIITNVSRVIHQARTHTMTQEFCTEVHATSALRIRIARQIYAKVTHAKRVMPRAKPVAVRLRATARRVIAPDRSRTSTTDIPGTSATSALKTRTAAQASCAQTMHA